MKNKKLFYWLLSGGEEGETPTQQAHSLTVSDKTETSETLTWENPFAVPDGYIALYHSGTEVDSVPVDGTDYSVGAEIGTGNFVGAKVLSGSPLSMTLIDLDPGTVYHYEIFAYNGSGSGIKYRTAPERGHLWTTDAAPATGMIGSDINAAKTLEVRSGGEDVYYRTRATVNDAWGSWTLWDSIPLAAFHAVKICEGDNIHNASGTPVAMKLLVGDHIGTAIAYAGYVPGDNFEILFTGLEGQTWNDISYNPNNSDATFISDSGTSRIATCANARTVSYNNTMDGNSIASVCHTNNPSIPTLICFKNPGTSGKGIAALVSGTWTLRDTTVGKTYHMIRFCPGLGGSSTRVFCSSADGTGNDALWSDDYFATSTIINITGAFGAFAFDATNIILAMFSRTAGSDIQITADGSNFESIDSPVANIVLFNGVADGNGFNACASSGSSLGIKTTPSNIGSAETRFNDYVDFIAFLNSNSFGLPSDNTIRDVLYGLQDFNLRSKFQAGWFADRQTDKNAVRVNLKAPGTFTLTETGTVDFSLTLGIRSASSSYFRTGWIPSVNNANQDSICIAHRVNDNVEATQFDYGCQDATGATERISINTHATDDTIANIGLNSSSVAATGSQTDSTGRYYNNRIGSTAADHDLYKNGLEFDGNNAARTSQPSTELYWGAFNSNGSASLFCTRYQGYLLIFTGLTPTDITNMDTLLDY